MLVQTRLTIGSNVQAHPMLYKLYNECPVKWTAVQERSISREFPVDLATETPSERVARIYNQFLWLPEVSASIPQSIRDPRECNNDAFNERHV